MLAKQFEQSQVTFYKNKLSNYLIEKTANECSEKLERIRIKMLARKYWERLKQKRKKEKRRSKIEQRDEVEIKS